jgi:hypothetical protein
MADKVIDVPGVGKVAFPDTMSDDEISKAVSAQSGYPTAGAGGSWEKQPPGPVRAVESFAGNIGQMAVNPYGVSMATMPPVDPNNPPPFPSWNPPGSVGEFFHRVTDPWKQELQNVANTITGYEGRKQGDPWAAGGQIGAQLYGMFGVPSRPGEGPTTGPSQWGGPMEAGASVQLPRSPYQQALDITKAVNPPVGEYRSMVNALQPEMGNITDFAKRTGNPLKTLEDLKTAAYGSSQEVRGIYKQRILDPIADNQVGAPPNFQGRRIGEGQQTTIGNLDARATAINDELRSNYMKRLEGQQREALASDADLRQELTSIDQTLYNEIAKRTGLTPDQVKQIRQTMGRQYQIGYQVEGAIYNKLAAQRGTTENTGMGGINKLTLGQLPVAAVNYLRGGPIGIANRAVGRAMSNVSINPTQTPNVYSSQIQQPFAPPGYQLGPVPPGTVPLKRMVP